jgi:general stress protein 26
MEREEILEVAREVCKGGVPFVLATVGGDGGPRMRWMGALVLDEPLTIFMAAGAKSRKITQIHRSPLAQMMFHTPDFSRVVTLYGNCSLPDDMATKKRLWEAIPELANYMKGPDDPEFGLVRFDAKKVELLMMREHGEMPLVAEV